MSAGDGACGFDLMAFKGLSGQGGLFLMAQFFFYRWISLLGKEEAADAAVCLLSALKGPRTTVFFPSPLSCLLALDSGISFTFHRKKQMTFFFLPAETLVNFVLCQTRPAVTARGVRPMDMRVAAAVTCVNILLRVQCVAKATLQAVESRFADRWLTRRATSSCGASPRAPAEPAQLWLC